MTHPPTESRRPRRCLDWSAIGYRMLNATRGSRVPSRSKSGFDVETMAACADATRPCKVRAAGIAGRFKEVVMKLYFAPGACSLSPHIVMRETGAKFELEQVNNQEKKTKSGTDYWTINAKGQVPVLEFDNGERLTEGPVIVQWIADQNPASGLVPPGGQARALSRPGVAQLHHLGAAQDVRPDLPADHARRLQGALQGEFGQALRLARQAARRQGLPDGRQVHRRRRLSVHRAALDARASTSTSPSGRTSRPMSTASPRVPRCRRR